MRTLKNCIRLSSSVKIYVPSTTNIDQPMDSEEIESETLKFLSQIFGGSTSTKAMGAWVTKGGSLVTEKVTICFSYAKEEVLQQNIDAIYFYCVRIKKQLSQESIALEINGELYLV